MSDIDTILATYGFIAIIIGVMIEGKSIIFIAGILVHHGSITFFDAVLASLIGAVLSNQGFYYFGRFYLEKFGLTKYKKKYMEKIIKIARWFKRNPFLVIALIPCIPGLRIITPIMIGSLRYSRIKFFIYDVVALIITSLILVTLGDFAGDVIEHLFQQEKKYNLLLILCVLIIATIMLIIRLRKRRLKKQASDI